MTPRPLIGHLFSRPLLLACCIWAGNPVAQAQGPAASAPVAAGALPTAVAAPNQRLWRCEVVYLPARSTWARQVALRFDAQQVREVQIDGQPVYSFQVQGTVLATSLDNERIQFDTHSQRWSSDFRGQAQGQGRCEPVG